MLSPCSTAVWVPGKAGHIVGRIIGPEVVEHEERIELRHLGEPKSAAQSNTGSFERRTSRKDLSDRARTGHGAPLSCRFAFHARE
jgi:hypothetical protein